MNDKSMPPKARLGQALFAAQPLTGEERASLQAAAQGKVRVLRVARGDQTIAAALPDALAIFAQGRWHFRRWETILNGGWRDGVDELYWTLLDGTEERLALSAPADLPFIFAERVRASIVATRGVQLPNELGAVQLAGRRPPADRDAKIIWTVLPEPRTDLNDARVQAAVQAEIVKLRAEFE